jgi:hypothetical protein
MNALCCVHLLIVVNHHLALAQSIIRHSLISLLFVMKDTKGMSKLSEEIQINAIFNLINLKKIPSSTITL